MADPFTMAAISIGTTVAGGALGAFGAAKKDDATAAMYQYKAGVAQANAQIAAQNRQYEFQLGGIEAQRVGLAGAQKMGQIKAEQAASGIDVNTGTGAKVRESELTGIQTSEGATVANAAKRAYGFSIEQMNMASEAALDTQAAKFTEQQKGLDVATSLLGGATSVADKWLKFSTAGVPGFGGGKTSGGGTGDLNVSGSLY